MKLCHCEVYSDLSLCACALLQHHSVNIRKCVFFFPTAIHVLSKCGISYFADLTGLLHITIQFCKAVIPHRDYTKLFFLAIRYSKDRTENNVKYNPATKQPWNIPHIVRSPAQRLTSASSAKAKS